MITLKSGFTGRTINMAELKPISDENMTPVDGGAYISERFRNPGESNATAAPAGNYTLAGIFAIAAVVAFIVMLYLLYQDWTALNVA